MLELQRMAMKYSAIVNHMQGAYKATNKTLKCQHLCVKKNSQHTKS